MVLLQQLLLSDTDMNMYKYANNMFYPYSLKNEYDEAGAWPEAGIDISEATFNEYTNTPPDGKALVTGKDGKPTWEDIPPLSPQQLVAKAKIELVSLKNSADSEISWRQDAVDSGIATEEEKTALYEWKKYRVLLMRVDTSAPEWPRTPAN